MSLFRWQDHQHFFFDKSHFKTIAVCGFSSALSGGNSTTAYKYFKNISYIYNKCSFKKSNFHTTKNKKRRRKKTRERRLTLLKRIF